MNDVLERDRDIAMVFQNYALYPHMTVAQNIAFSLKLSGGRGRRSGSACEDTAELLGLEDLLDRRAQAAFGRPAAAGRDGHGRSSASRRRS